MVRMAGSEGGPPRVAELPDLMPVRLVKGGEGWSDQLSGELNSLDPSNGVSPEPPSPLLQESGNPRTFPPGSVYGVPPGMLVADPQRETRNESVLRGVEAY